MALRICWYRWADTWRSEHTHCLYFSLLSVANKICQQNGSSANKRPASITQKTRCGGCNEAFRGFRSMASRNWHIGMSRGIGNELRTSAWVVIMMSRPYKSVPIRPSSAAIVRRTCWHESNSWFIVRGAAAQRQLRNFMHTIMAAFSPIQTIQRLSENRNKRQPFKREASFSCYPLSFSVCIVW